MPYVRGGFCRHNRFEQEKILFWEKCQAHTSIFYSCLVNFIAFGTEDSRFVSERNESVQPHILNCRETPDDAFSTEAPRQEICRVVFFRGLISREFLLSAVA